jgi:glycosyltransferase involved in cell wall biosynthesis
MSEIPAGPILSVIAPAFNQEDCIIPFLASVETQTWRDFEFIVVDDGSTDRTAELIQAYLPRLGRRTRFIHHTKNQGAMASVTEAFSLASGEICLKLDADGLFEPGTFARVMDSFASDEQVGIVTALVKAADRSNWIVRGAEILCAARQRCYQVGRGYTTSAYGNCFAFRRHLFSQQEIYTRTDIDLSQLARKRGWKIALRQDIVIQTRFPATLAETFNWGRRRARVELDIYWRHKDMLPAGWAFWAKFIPLGLGLGALFKPKWALAGLLGWLGIAQAWLAHVTPEYAVTDRLAGWGISLVRWIGFDLELFLMAVRAVTRRLGLA